MNNNHNINNNESNDKEDKKEIITLSIELEDNHTEYLKIYKNSIPNKVAYNFCLEHNLNYDSLLKLTSEIENAINESKKKKKQKQKPKKNNSYESLNKIPIESIENISPIKNCNSSKNIHNKITKNKNLIKKEIKCVMSQQKYNFKDISKNLKRPIIYEFKITIKGAEQIQKKPNNKSQSKKTKNIERNEHFIGNNSNLFKEYINYNENNRGKLRTNYLSPTVSSSSKIKRNEEYKNNNDLCENNISIPVLRKSKRKKTYSHDNIKIINIINNNNVNDNNNNNNKLNFGERLYQKNIKLKELSQKKTKDKVSKDKKEEIDQCTFKPRINKTNIKSIKFNKNEKDKNKNIKNIKNINEIDKKEKIKKEMNSSKPTKEGLEVRKKSMDNIKNNEIKSIKNVNVNVINNKNSIIQKRDSNSLRTKEEKKPNHKTFSEKSHRAKENKISIFEKLYNQKSTTKNLEEKIYNKKELFRPKTNHNYKGVYNNASFTQRQKIYKAKSTERKKKLAEQAYPDVDPRTGQKFFHPTINKNHGSHRVSKCSNLYLNALAGKTRKEELQKRIYNKEKKDHEFRVSGNSDNIFSHQINKSLKKIFLSLDKNQNGKLSQFNYSTKELPSNIKKIINPLLVDIDLKNKILDEEKFIDECKNLYKKLNYYEKREIYNFSDIINNNNNNKFYSISCYSKETIDKNNNDYSNYCLTNNDDINSYDTNIYSSSFYRIKSDSSQKDNKDKSSDIVNSKFNVNEYYVNTNHFNLNEKFYNYKTFYGKGLEGQKRKCYDNLIIQRTQEEIS